MKTTTMRVSSTKASMFFGFHALVFLLAFVLLFSSCGKDDNQTSNTNNNPYPNYPTNPYPVNPANPGTNPGNFEQLTTAQLKTKLEAMSMKTTVSDTNGIGRNLIDGFLGFGSDNQWLKVKSSTDNSVTFSVYDWQDDPAVDPAYETKTVKKTDIINSIFNSGRFASNSQIIGACYVYSMNTQKSYMAYIVQKLDTEQIAGDWISVGTYSTYVVSHKLPLIANPLYGKVMTSDGQDFEKQSVHYVNGMQLDISQCLNTQQYPL